MAGTAAAVENGAAARPGCCREQRLDEATEAAEPKVIALGARGCFEKTIHVISSGEKFYIVPRRVR